MQNGTATDHNDVAEKAHTIHRQGNRLLALINQLLDIAKIKSAVGNADWRCGDITTFIGMVVDSYRDYARSRNIELLCFNDQKTVMDFVPDYVEKVMGNLLSNAMKFTPEYGRVSVKIREDGGMLHVDVADTGDGMSKETLAHIFEPFYQAETELQHIGTGLGLALVKQIVDSVGGTLTVESVLRRGTTFHISVPVRQDFRDRTVKTEKETATVRELINALLATDTAPDDTVNDDDEERILIVEDNHDVAEYIGSLLSNDYAVYYARNGKEGQERAKMLIPDLIVSDLMMPGMSGLEMCRNIRADFLTSHIPVIILTAKVTEKDRIEGVEAGADAYITKPFSTEELRTRIRKLLEQRQNLREKFSATDSITTTTADTADENARGAGSIKKKAADGQLQATPTVLSSHDEAFLIKVTDTVYVMLNSFGQVDVNAVAAKMCMSYSQLYRKLSAVTNCTPAQYILRIKVDRAQRMLERHPELSLREVADRCGFNDYTSFVRAFRNVCGVTPSQYAKKE
ncbi:MAG: ATP-binding protein [Prevotella sp.]